MIEKKLATSKKQNYKTTNTKQDKSKLAEALKQNLARRKLKQNLSNNEVSDEEA